MYVVSVGVSATTYVSSPPTSAPYTKVADWIFLAISLGRTEREAPVPHVSVPACDSAVVAISTLPATVVLAFGVVPVARFVHAHPI